MVLIKSGATLGSIPDAAASVRRRGRRWPAAFAFTFLVTIAIPSQAGARALVRFVHAVPGVGRVQVSVAGRPRAMGSIDFGKATPWRDVASGPLRWSLSSGGRTAASGTTRVGTGAYDLVVLARGARVRVRAYRASAGRAGVGLVRVIHAAPGLGSPELRVDGAIAVRRLSYTGVTPYLALKPGRHRLAADRPGDPTPFLSETMTVRAGAADSVVVLGSDGRRVRTITLADRDAPARQAGETGSAATIPHLVLVKPGDSLWSIARRLVGRGASDSAVMRRLISIWHVNARRIGTGDPSLIYPGTRLRV